MPCRISFDLDANARPSGPNKFHDSCHRDGGSAQTTNFDLSFALSAEFSKSKPIADDCLLDPPYKLQLPSRVGFW